MNDISKFSLFCFVLGLVLFISGIVLSLFFPEIERTHTAIWIVAVSISAALVVAFLPGTTQISIPKIATATGGVGIFVLSLYLLYDLAARKEASEPLRNESARLQADLEESKSAVAELNTIKSDLASKLNDSVAQLQQLRLEADRLQSEVKALEPLRAEQPRLQSILKQSELKIADLNVIKESLEVQLKDSNSRLKALSSEMNNLRHDLTKANTNSLEATRGLEKCSYDKQHEHEQVRSAMLIFKTHMDELSSRTESLKEKVDRAGQYAYRATVTEPRRCLDHAAAAESILDDAFTEGIQLDKKASFLVDQLRGVERW